MEVNECDECGHVFTSREELEHSDADVVETKTCDIVDGQYIEFFVISPFFKLS
jgi:hypothetical protein